MFRADHLSFSSGAYCRLCPVFFSENMEGFPESVRLKEEENHFLRFPSGLSKTF